MLYVIKRSESRGCRVRYVVAMSVLGLVSEQPVARGGWPWLRPGRDVMDQRNLLGLAVIMVSWLSLLPANTIAQRKSLKEQLKPE